MLPRSFYDESPLQSLEDKLAALRIRSLQEPATRAWNFATALYFKANGIPWRLADVPASTCFAGISFFRHDTISASHMHASLAQLFTDRGDALVLRGERFEWDIKTQGTPHVSRDQASRLAARIVATYKDHVHRPPERVVFHKSSRFTADERDGFIEGIKNSGVSHYDLVSFYSREVRVFRYGQYPPLRGTLAEVPRGGAFLYTMGYIPVLDTYPKGHVPRPLELIETWGDSDLGTICREILGLTKLNWNCCDHAGAYPITLRFASRVGHVLSELPDNQEPHPHYRFYV
jgi:hypothetical protein